MGFVFELLFSRQLLRANFFASVNPLNLKRMRAIAMEKPLIASLWAAVALYAIIGLFGVFVFHDVNPSILDLTGGYGVGYSTVAVSDAVR